MRRLGVVLVAAMLAACGTSPVPPPQLSAAAQAAQKSEFTVVPEDERQLFPTWSTVDLDGYDWNTSNLGARITVVNLWASWCQPCRDEWPELQTAQEAHPSVAFIGINTMDDNSAAKSFIKEFPSAYRQLVDGNATIIKSLQNMPNTMLPMTIVLDHYRRIAAWKSGPVLKGQLRRVLATLLTQ